MKNIRVIARLDIKTDYLVKGIHLEGLRRIGDPREMAQRYYTQGIDEIVLNDVVASLYERNSLTDIIRDLTKDVFVPITVIGGIRSVADVEAALRAGADKVGINTAALRRPDLIGEVAKQFGSQCMVLSVEARANKNGGWEALYDSGREKSGRDVIDWIRQAVDLGAGEVLVTSVDRDGTGRGMDIDLIRHAEAASAVPVVASGGVKTAAHVVDAVRLASADAVAVASALHYDWLGIEAIKRALIELNDVEIRMVEGAHG
jgi:cyclase